EGDDDRTAANRSREGGLAVGVPGEPAGIEALIEQLGSRAVTRAQITAPAIRHATEGFEAGPTAERSSRWVGAQIRRDPVLAAFFPPGSDFIPATHRITNPALARTLRQFAQHGAAPFYRGAIAR